jgi:uncharacterized protein (TIGR00369 family)
MTSGNDTPEVDAGAFFHDDEFHRKYPGVRIPPPCFLDAGAKIIAYEPNKSLTVRFPVLDKHANPVGFLQGGVLCSLFDNVFGPLSFSTLRKPCVSIDMNVNFIRAAKPGEFVTIRAEFASKTKKLLQMTAEARNEKDKIVATATSSLMVYEP